MSRAERRKAGYLASGSSVDSIKDIQIDLTNPLAKELKDGDKITIAGVKRMPDGTINMNCKPGEESLWRVMVCNGQI